MMPESVARIVCRYIVRNMNYSTAKRDRVVQCISKTQRGGTFSNTQGDTFLTGNPL